MTQQQGQAFDWSKQAVATQRAVAVYHTPEGVVIIRQPGAIGTADEIIKLTSRHACEAVIEALKSSMAQIK